MLISQIFDPADLVSLNERQINILSSIATSEIVASPTIKAELTKKLRVALNAMKGPGAKKPG
jgi:hypothetical protein